jgi:hypothetical protein
MQRIFREAAAAVFLDACSTEHVVLPQLKPGTTEIMHAPLLPAAAGLRWDRHAPHYFWMLKCRLLVTDVYDPNSLSATSRTALPRKGGES